MDQKELKVYAVFYKENKSFVVITLDFIKWLKDNNKRRKEEGQLIEHAFEFELFEDIIKV